MRTRQILVVALMLPGLAGLTGCATGRTKEILWGMAAGAAVGYIVGNQFVHHGQYQQYKQQNTAATAAIFALGTGAVLNWHYDSLQENEVQISGRFARTRLCEPGQLDPELVKQLSGSGGAAQTITLRDEQIGKQALSLDDETKWAFPSFQKRFLQPESGDSQVISSRYIWEIIRPGRFVTRSQNPDFFVEPNPPGPTSTEEGKAK